MKKLLVFLASLSLVACAGMMSGGTTVRVNLSGAEEVPPVSVPGSGNGDFTVGENGSVTGSITTAGVEGTMAHIHIGARGTNGPVIVPLTKGGDTYSAPAGAKLNSLNRNSEIGETVRIGPLSSDQPGMPAEAAGSQTRIPGGTE